MLWSYKIRLFRLDEVRVEYVTAIACNTSTENHLMFIFVLMFFTLFPATAVVLI